VTVSDVRDSTESSSSPTTADSNVRDGIRSRGTSANNTFKDKPHAGNTEHDAHDDKPQPEHLDRQHLRDGFPAGTICRP